MPQLNRLKRPPIDSWPFKTELLFPQGLFGFEQYRRYWLIGHEHEMPFLRLESQENEMVSFFVVDPFLGHPDYVPTLSSKDLADVGVAHDAKLILLAIVNKNERPYTMNLEAPLLIHWHKKVGKQLLIRNDPEYPLELN